MLYLYFSGTGNSKYCIEYFAKGIGDDFDIYSIEDADALEKIKQHMDIVFAYPIYYSTLPKILADYIDNHSNLWKGKNVFLMATMGLFSGDGTGVLARPLKKYGANIIGGIHLTMPDCIIDVKLLKKSEHENRKLVEKSREKMDKVIGNYKCGKYPKEGLHWWNHIAGLLGQRLYFKGKTAKYTDKLKIDLEKCVGCGACTSKCPMGNIAMVGNKAVAGDRCTMCYRCISNCPKKAITLIGKEVVADSFMI